MTAEFIEIEKKKLRKWDKNVSNYLGIIQPKSKEEFLDFMGFKGLVISFVYFFMILLFIC